MASPFVASTLAAQALIAGGTERQALDSQTADHGAADGGAGGGEETAPGQDRGAGCGDDLAHVVGTLKELPVPPLLRPFMALDSGGDRMGNHG